MTDSKKDDCAIVQDLLPLYADGLTSPESSAFIRSHLAGCEKCTRALEAMQETAPAVPVSDIPAANCLEKTGKVLRRRRIMALAFALLSLCLFGLLSLSLLEHARMSADQVLVSATHSGKELDLVLSARDKDKGLTSVQSSQDENGVYRLRVLGSWLLAKGQPEKTVRLTEPVREVWLNEDLVWQDGTVITPRCRQLYPLANGYAGSTSQMQLAQPAVPDESVQIKADTADPEHCTWSFTVDTLQSLPEIRLEEKAFTAMILTPNLDAVSYKYKDTDWITFTRQQLLKRLGTDEVTVTDLASLQRLLERILPDPE